jgi:hypothetical protein
MLKPFISNILLCLGVLMLLGFGVLEIAGLPSDPLLPAFSALLIGGTAVLDRVGAPQL